MPITQTKHYGSGDNTWLASDHGLFNAKTFTLDPANAAYQSLAAGATTTGEVVTG